MHEIVVITFQFSFFIRRQTKIQITNHPLWREADNFSQHFWSSLFVGNPPNSLNIMKLPKNMAKIGHNLYFSLQATIIIFISKQNEGIMCSKICVLRLIHLTEKQLIIFHHRFHWFKTSWSSSIPSPFSSLKREDIPNSAA